MTTNYKYTTPLPVSTNNPSVDQPSMTINNASVSTIIGIDHVGFNLDNGGTHQQVTLLTPLGSDPGGLSGTQAEVYTKAISGVAQLFMQNGSIVAQITGIQSSSTGGSSGVAGFKLSNGLIINYCLDTAFTIGGNAYTFQTTYPYTSFFVVLPVLLGGPFSSTTATIVSASKNNGLLGFSGFSSRASNAVDWMAFGI